MANNVIFKSGTKASYNALEQKDVHTLYWLTDAKEIRKGEILYGIGRLASQQEDGLMSAADKAKLDSITGDVTANLTPVDASVVITDGESGGKAIGVQISKETNNAITLKSDGLFANAEIPEYSIEKQGEADDGFSSTYRLKKTVGSSVTYSGDSINIPKDLVIQGGSVKEVIEEDVPYEGAQIGDPYIELVLNDPSASHIYIPAKGLIDTSDFATSESVTALQSVINSLPDEFMSEITSVDRTETTNTAQIRLSIKQPNGTYTTSQEHGILTLIGAGYGADGKSGAGLMTLADKQKLDSIDTEMIAGLADSLTWGSL